VKLVLAVEINQNEWVILKNLNYHKVLQKCTIKKNKEKMIL
jgi:hypothetical protein